MKKIITIIILLFLTISLVLAHSDETEIEKGKELVKNSVECEKLSNEDLEAIGEYVMEQMHPGELHELMHERMGIKEDTGQHELFHINIAKMMYCRTGNTIDKRMNIMGGGMMSMMYGSGMMGYGLYGGSALWWLWSLLAFLLLLGLVVLVWVLTVKYWKETQRKK